MNLAAVASLIIGVMIIFITQQAEVGSMSALIQPAAFFVVVGGTLCATLLNFPYDVVVKSFHASMDVFRKNNDKDPVFTIQEIVDIAHYARRNGLLSLRNVADTFSDPFLNRGIQLAVDYSNTQLVYDILNAEIIYDEEQELIYSRVFEAMGGYAPTFGVVGAVLGLIQVMGFIQEPEVLAKGIATAFVATLYGVGVANLVLLPIAGNLKLKLREKVLLKEIILQGIISVQLEENPIVIEEKLMSYLKLNNKTTDFKLGVQTSP